MGSFVLSLYGLTASSTQTTARTYVRSARYARQSRRELNVPRRHPRAGGRFSGNVGKFRSLAENVKLNEAQINDVSRALADVPSLIIRTYGTTVSSAVRHRYDGSRRLRQIYSAIINSDTKCTREV